MSFLSDEPVKLLSGGDGIGDGVLAGDDDRRGRIGDPGRRGKQIGGGLQRVAGVVEPGDIGWPGQNDVVAGRGDGS